jgi:hypothetical protein
MACHVAIGLRFSNSVIIESDLLAHIGHLQRARDEAQVLGRPRRRPNRRTRTRPPCSRQIGERG